MKSSATGLACILFVIGFSLALGVRAPAAVKGYYRFPAIHGDRVVFCAEGDLWEVSTDGGIAVRLTRHEGNEEFPRFSPDGRLIAFSGEYEGNQDVHVMPADGGEPKRLTFHPGPDQVVAWRPDGKRVVFRSMRQSPNRTWNLYEVPVEGGFPRPLPVGIACLASFSPEGNRIAFNRFSREFRTWKRYYGGTAQDIWIGDLARGSFRKVTVWKGTDRFPLWMEGRLYFLSDRTGRLNIHSMTPDGSDVRCHTEHVDFDARWPDGHQGRIVYMYAGGLRLLDTASGKDRAIEILLPSDRVRHRPRFEDAAKTLEDYLLGPRGKRILLSSRGELWVRPVKEGRIVALTRSPGVRERGPAISPDGKRVACITDETGEQEIALFDAKGEAPHRVLTHRGKGWIFPPAWSPEGKHLAYADLTMNLFLVDVESGEVRRVDGSGREEIREYTFSPDGKWLAYTKTEDNDFSSIYLYEIAAGETHAVTTPFTMDHDPAWDPEGKYLYFLSDRAANPVLGEMDLSFTVVKPTRPYALILAKDGKSPFLPEELLEEKKEDGEEGAAKKEDGPRKGKPEGEKETEKPPPVKVDLEGIRERTVPFPVPAGRYGALAAVKGKIFYLSFPVRGLLEMPIFGGERAPANTLHLFDLKKKKDEVFLDKVRDYRLSRNGKFIAFRAGKVITVTSTAAKPPKMPIPGMERPEPDRVDPSDLPLAVDPSAEWAQIFHEAWRLERDFYFAPDMAKIDWEGVRARYEPLLPRIATREELNDLIGQVIGELGTSHTYVFGGDTVRPKHVGVGLLGADLAYDAQAGAFRITRVLRPEPWEADVPSPLAMSHARVPDGAYLFAVNGVDLGPGTNVYAALAGLAGAQVRLTVGLKPDRSDARPVQVEALQSEGELRYRDWCRRNRAYVEERSGGRIGYFHMPDMMGRGLSAFIRGFYPQLKKEALVIDARYNGGGFVSQMIIERLRRKVLGYDQPRRGGTASYPGRVHPGYKAVLINQLAGSDGDIFPYVFKKCRLGPVIGMRTWGGVVGIRGDKRFIDGGLSTQPEFAWWDEAQGFDLENHGVEPDIEVDIPPEDFAAGRDPQLDRAIAELLRMLEEKPVRPPEPPPYPDKSFPGKG